MLFHHPNKARTCQQKGGVGELKKCQGSDAYKYDSENSKSERDSLEPRASEVPVTNPESETGSMAMGSFGAKSPSA